MKTKKENLTFLMIALFVVIGTIGGIILLSMNPKATSQDANILDDKNANGIDTSKLLTAYTGKVYEDPTAKLPEHPYVIAQREKAKMDWEEYNSKIKSKNEEDRKEAYWILRYGEVTVPLNKVYRDLEKGIKEPSDEVREAAIEAVCEYTDDPTVLPLYESVMDDKHPDDKENVLQALFNMEWNYNVERIVAKALYDENEDVRDLALSVINNSIEEDSFDTVEDARKKYGDIDKGGL